ncbi:MAG TPA: 23S rRNA (uracil(1939)-C(5))-methyltransferase RlmD, partial [Candidatus Tenderia electrophaga]|nr:23S rRNA (uracil(1939)-C(5))-methyltransferase RlmD [Candidatus Tenderia electrophaga]
MIATFLLVYFRSEKPHLPDPSVMPVSRQPQKSWRKLMARRRRKSKPMPSEAFPAEIESLDHDGRGVARIDGKATFIEGALPGEEVTFHYLTQRKSYDEGVVSEIINASPDRVEPKCPHFGVCGGCSLQHMDAQAQIMAKQQIMLDNFKHIGSVQPESVLAPLTAIEWGYRRKARLGCRYVAKKESVLVGFREKRTGWLAEMSRCEVMHPAIGERIMELRQLVSALECYQRLPQIEVAIGDDVIALVFRHMDDLSDEDKEKLIQFGQQHDIHIYLQPKGPDSVHLIWPEQSQLSYRLQEFDLEMLFKPTDFTQVNTDINRKMLNQAIAMLDPQADDRVLDLFCGLGNFTLPLARRAGHVVGVEGEMGLVQRGKENAVHNQIDNVEFHAADLTQEPHQHPWFGSGFDKLLIDPPRSGAFEIVKHVPAFGANRIVYVSCN